MGLLSFFDRTRDITWGCYSKLHVRVRPLNMRGYGWRHMFCFDPHFEFRRNGRCYCPGMGWHHDLKIVLFGYGVIVWVSRYTGEVPCECDKMIAEIWELSASVPTDHSGLRTTAATYNATAVLDQHAPVTEWEVRRALPQGIGSELDFEDKEEDEDDQNTGLSKADLRR